jgi:hypothetical protein
MKMSQADLIGQQIQEVLDQLKQVKNATNNLKARQNALSSQPVATAGGHLKQALSSILPPHMMPKNVGHMNHVQWPFNYQVDFDLSTTTGWPNITEATSQTQSFQVSQEAAFLATGISRHADDYNDAGDLGPWQIEIRDRQSSRFFNNAPIPIQMIGIEGHPTVLPTPFLILPNAFVEVTMSNFLDTGVTQNMDPDASGKHQFSFWGFRLRVEDAEKVLSSIFG